MSSLTFENLKIMAQEFIDQLIQGDFKEAAAKFDEPMKTALDETKLQELAKYNCRYRCSATNNSYTNN